MQENNPQYEIKSSLEIAHLLQSAQDSRSLLLMQPPNRSFNAVTVILHISQKDGLLILDGLRNQEDTRRLQRSEQVLCETSIDKISLWFKTDGIEELQYQGKPALRVGFPTVVSYLQRRNSFRVQVPTSRDIHYAVEGTDIKDPKFRVIDISCSGMALSDDSALLDTTPGTIYSGIINLDQLGSVAVKARVVHFFETTVVRGEHERKNRRIGMAFEDISSSDTIRIQSLVNRLQRDIIMRERERIF